MATLKNKMNREVKVIIPNMREFRVFYSDNEGSVMFFKRDWEEDKQEVSQPHWKPSDEQMRRGKIQAQHLSERVDQYLVQGCKRSELKAANDALKKLLK